MGEREPVLRPREIGRKVPSVKCRRSTEDEVTHTLRVCRRVTGDGCLPLLLFGGDGGARPRWS